MINRSKKDVSVYDESGIQVVVADTTSVVICHDYDSIELTVPLTKVLFNLVGEVLQDVEKKPKEAK